MTRLMLHAVAGDPDLETSFELIRLMADSGADLLEIQIPFSDPMADGPVIMAANQRALEKGVTPLDCIHLLERLRRHLSIPILIMTYANLPMSMGWNRFFEGFRSAGANGVIVPDLPHDEPLPGRSTAPGSKGMPMIPVLSPGMKEDRLKEIIHRAPPLLYLTLRVGTTGCSSGVAPQGLSFVQKVRELTSLPLAGGFGIASTKHLLQLRGVVDVAVIGSHLIQLRRQGGFEKVSAFIDRCRMLLKN